MNQTPILTNTYADGSGTTWFLEYYQSDTFAHLSLEECAQTYGFSFYQDKILIVNNVNKPGTYTPVGGSVESGENPDDALVREIQEESNMKVLYLHPIGYQRVTDVSGIQKPYYQLRYFCIVEPYGPFISDPDGDVTEVIEILPQDYKKYFDWGEIGDKIMERAIELKETCYFK
jgi:8-oxo-dGTP pyrophosphatase MutT (NUDIX family)